MQLQPLGAFSNGRRTSSRSRVFKWNVGLPTLKRSHGRGFDYLSISNRQTRILTLKRCAQTRGKLKPRGLVPQFATRRHVPHVVHFHQNRGVPRWRNVLHRALRAVVKSAQGQKGEHSGGSKSGAMEASTKTRWGKLADWNGNNDRFSKGLARHVCS
jgi:hypothetical protein